MKIGITGTRNGTSDYQLSELIAFFQNLSGPVELHHGDCIGVDTEVATIAKACGFKVVCHPPVKPSLRGFFNSDEYRQPLSYFQRNRNIVNETELLLVVPKEDSWQPNGGTWYTCDYAKKQNRPYQIFWPQPLTTAQLNAIIYT